MVSVVSMKGDNFSKKKKKNKQQIGSKELWMFIAIEGYPKYILALCWGFMNSELLR